MPKPFEKGHDPRRNKRGRPRTFDQVRALAQQIAKEPAMTQDGKPVIFNERHLTVIDLILRTWASSKKPQLQALFVEYAYGKVPHQVDVQGDTVLRVIFDDILPPEDDAGIPGQDT